MLGTAALGMPYGVSNPPVTPDTDSVFAIFDLAWESGITCFDTAPAYGLAEKRLGEWSRSRGLSADVVTKLPSLGHVPDSGVTSAVAEAVDKSAKVLEPSRIAGYLTHDSTDFLRPAVRQALERTSEKGLIETFGPSVYTGADVRRALAAARPAILQLPVSALDQRIVSDGTLDACREAGTRVFARSIFLQGVMLMPPEDLPAHLSRLREAVAAFMHLASESGTGPLSLAVRFALQTPGVTSVVVGAISCTQLSEIVSAGRQPDLDEATREALRRIAGPIPSDLLDPRRWPR